MYNKVASMIEDLSFDDFTERQRFEISEQGLVENVRHAHAARHFLFADNRWTPLEYNGAAIVSMTDANSQNSNLINRLVAIQTELALALEPKNAFYFLPKESFHQTIANLLSEGRFKQNIIDAGLEGKYPHLIKDALDSDSDTASKGPLKMKMTGLSLFGTAIGFLGTFENEEDYQRIIDFRSRVYNSSLLHLLDIRRTRPFVGHITVAYIEGWLNDDQKNQLAATTIEINRALAGETNYFTFDSAEFRRYHHLAEFVRLSDYPVFKF